MLKLDITDKKILQELDSNSRIPISLLSKKLKISRDIISYRFKKYKKDRLIQKYHTIIDISKLGYTAHKVFIKLQDIKNQEEVNFIEWVKKNPEIIYSASYDGKFDLVISIRAKNMEDLENSLKKINKKFGKFIAEKEIATIIRGEYSPREYLFKGIVHKKEPFFGSIPKEIKTDDYDKKILLELSKDSRVTSVEISKKINLSAEAISKRIKRLEKRGLIQGYNIIPEEKNYPFIHHKILISLKNIDEENERKFKEYCKNQKNIWYSCSCIGSWDFEIDIDSEDIKKFRESLRELKNMFSEIIKEYTVMMVYQTNKYNFYPSIN